MLKEQFNTWSNYRLDIKEQIKIIVVDDGSQTYPLSNYSIDGIDLTLYRIEEDKGWNNGGAKNLAMSECTTEWAYLSDLDHILTEKNLIKLLELKQDRSIYYTFTRYNMGTQHKMTKAQNIFYINKDVFWEAKGYDEDFSGKYGYEDNWLKHNLVKLIREKTSSNIVIYVATHIKDSITSSAFKKDISINKKLLRNKQQGLIPQTNDILRFKWRKI